MLKKIAIPVIFLAVGFGVGFAAGVYVLPIYIAYKSEPQQAIDVVQAEATDPIGQFDRNSPGSDALHWGEGTVRISSGKLVFEEDVKLAPGPDYRIYLSRTFADTKSDFTEIKPHAVEISKLKTFSGPLEFELPEDLNAHEFDNVIVWCETFSMYIASARLE